MLSKTQLVNIKDALNQTFIDTCDIYNTEKIINDDGTSYFNWVCVHENIPCKLSFSSTNKIDKNSSVPSLDQTVTLFLSNDIEVLSGSKITVNKNGNTITYRNSGFPLTFLTHQEINLILQQEFA